MEAFTDHHITSQIVRVDTRTAGVTEMLLLTGERLCDHCGGAGFWDSCFSCDNRGTVREEVPPAHIESEHDNQVDSVELITKLARGLFLESEGGFADLGMWADCGDLTPAEYELIQAVLQHEWRIKP